MLAQKREEERLRREAPLREAERAMEDEVMVMIYGPDWRRKAPP